MIERFTDRFCGGRDLDLIIVNYLSEKFYLKHKIDLFSHKKSLLRLLIEVKKTREILSYNTESNITVESIINDIDFSYYMTRNEFEKICQPVFEKFEKLLINVKMYLNKINLTNLVTIEMAGECMKTPITQQLIKKIFNQDIAKTMNIDECISKGCFIYVNFIKISQT